MGRKSLINDVSLEDEDSKGEPILFTNQEIRRMFRLANLGPKDVFYDLGSGWGQNLIIALAEFGAKRVVGIELEEERKKKSLERLGKWAKKYPNLRGRYDVIQGNFDDRLKGANLKEATLIYYGLYTYPELIAIIEQNWKGADIGRRLVYYFKCLFPEIVPNDADFPFFVSRFPFRKPKSEFEWLSAVVRKPKVKTKGTKPTDELELWDELIHDYDLNRQAGDIRDYKERLRRVVKGRG